MFFQDSLQKRNIHGIRVLLGSIPFSREAEGYYIHFALGSRMNRVWFVLVRRNGSNTRKTISSDIQRLRRRSRDFKQLRGTKQSMECLIKHVKSLIILGEIQSNSLRNIEITNTTNPKVIPLFFFFVFFYL